MIRLRSFDIGQSWHKRHKISEAIPRNFWILWASEISICRGGLERSQLEQWSTTTDTTATDSHSMPDTESKAL